MVKIMSIRVILADDHQVMRHGLRVALDQEPGFEVVAEAENGVEAVRLAKALRPEVILLDVAMPDVNGIEASRRISAEAPTVKIVGLSMYADKRYVMGMLKAGASGYLLKTCTFQELTNCLQVVVGGRTYLTPEVSSLVIETAIRPMEMDDKDDLATLTSREREILQLIAEGAANKDMARRLCLSERTVETYRRQIMSKLNLRTVADLTKIAIRTGLTKLDK